MSLVIHYRILFRECHWNLQEWRRQHAFKVRLMNSTHNDLEKFIAQQAENGDACHARMLEAKQTLDHLLHDVHTLALEMGSHETVLETEIENLNMTKLSVDVIEETYKEELEACKKEQKEASAESEQYRAELRELDQIANPEVTYKHNATNSSKAASLLQMGKLRPARCLAFVQFMHHHGYADAPGVGIKNETCNKQRKELEELFTETYKAIQKLMKDADARSKDDMCSDGAESKKMAELTPITMQRERTSSKISEASESISNLEPVVAMAKQRAKMMEDHIENVLKPECADVEGVSKMLRSIRDLIVSVEKCPGRNKLRLKIPESVTTKTTAAPSSGITSTLSIAGKDQVTTTKVVPAPLDDDFSDFGFDGAEDDAENT